jgi:1,4-dihydroxy-2-naphthoate octaprenyltransferase
MNLWFVMNDYFQGEKIEALIFILSVGLLSLIFGVWLLSESGAFEKGVAIPFLVLALICITVGSVVGFRTPNQLKDLKSGLETQKEETIKSEIIRMTKVNQAWPKYLVVWIAFGVIGLILRTAVKNDFYQGLGIALVFFSGVTLLIDGFAERRAIKYMESLQSNQNSENI